MSEAIRTELLDSAREQVPETVARRKALCGFDSVSAEPFPDLSIAHLESYPKPEPEDKSPANTPRSIGHRRRPGISFYVFLWALSFMLGFVLMWLFLQTL